ncbi:MAG: hypothetical protein FWE95_03795 [Planctomycetaceae bacterium]|nr:hypothetical protein [Planctomycetaceae bacterium]
MSKQKTDWQQDIIPGYDPVQCKREAHAEIREETKGMTSEEICKYFHKAAEEGNRRRAEQRLRQASQSQT